MVKRKALVLASGSKTGGGSGFENLFCLNGIVQADFVAVASNYADGGVFQRTRNLGAPFVHFPGPWTAEA